MRRGTSQKWTGILLLLLVAVIWGSAFSAQRVAAGQASILLFNGVRFTLGGITLLPFLFWRNRSNRSSLPTELRVNQLSRAEIAGITAAGVLLFTAGGLQHYGLRFTTAGNAGFLTSLYIIFVPVLATMLDKVRFSIDIWAGAGLALVGAYLLSGFRFNAAGSTFNTGDGLEILGAFFWAGHVILLDKLVKKGDVLLIAAGQFFVCAIISLAFGLLLEAGTISQLGSVWRQALYTGVVSVGLGYTLQAYGQRYIPPSNAALLLSLEAVFAVVFGMLWLGETLTQAQAAGCGLILAAVLIVQRERVGILPNEA